MENFLGSKRADFFFFRGINKLLEEREDVIQNNGEYTIDWNLFIDKLFVDELYFTKMKIIYYSIHFHCIIQTGEWLNACLILTAC